MPMSYSVEFFPPKDESGEARLWEAMEQLRVLNLDFISVTYGAGGSSRDRTIRITKEIKERTGINTVAHLTCVGSTKNEILEILGQYRDAGITSILALRGDPTGGPRSEWVEIPNGLNHADELIALAKSFNCFEIGVAAFPDGHPASAGGLEQDIEVLLRKEQLGATFATTQFFFEAVNYFKLQESLENRGSNLKLIPGILPITNIKQLKRMAELNGTPIPEKIEKLFSIDQSPEEVREIGIEIATNLGSELIANDAPGLHFYTMNTSESTVAIVKNLGIIHE
jgi:methylenetetrahydrofolate reductase (NADPH)